MGTEEINTEFDIKEWISALAYDQWISLPVPGSRPSARYKHAATVADEKLYVTGGSRNGRYLSDIQVFDLRTLIWNTPKLLSDKYNHESGNNSPQEVLPATSGHSVVKWRNKLLLLGGRYKELSNTFTVLAVRSIDLETKHCCIVKTSGKIPIARGGHSITLIDSRLIMFGGEDTQGQLLNDVHILDLETMTWDVPETMRAPPSPRFDHTAALHAKRYLLIFGGCSHSICFNDLHILDLQTMEWSEPQTQGDAVSPRAGHAGVSLDGNWYIVGGGDNRSGASETLMLNMSNLVWSVLTSVKERDPLASEGLSLCSTLVNGEKLLVAFGGYYGKYNNEVFILRTKPRESARPKIFQSHAAAASAASVSAAYAFTSKEKENFHMSNMEDANFMVIKTEVSPKDFTNEINTVTAEKNMLQLSLTEITTENSRRRGELSEMKDTHAELSKELLSVKGQLAAESLRCFQLEAQIAELRKTLESLPSIEDKLQVLRNEEFALERDTKFSHAGTTQRQNSGGVWKWIAGGTPDQ